VSCVLNMEDLISNTSFFLIRQVTEKILYYNVGFFPSGFPTKILYEFLYAPMRATTPARLIILDFIILIILDEDYNL
jgi:hypothetical protein